MNKELYVSTMPHETRLALAEDGEVAEVYVEREHEYSLAGAIYKGRVTRVLPGMQSAFVDIGLERDAFLYVSDFFEDSEEYDRVVGEAEKAVEKLHAVGARRPASEPVIETTAADEAVAEAPVIVAPGEADERLPDAGSENRDGREDRRRRGRRGRRGRTGSIPDAKFARPEDVLSAPPAEARAHADDEAEADADISVAPASASTPPPADAAQPGYPAIVLPGESLAKYRPAPPPRARETSVPAPRAGKSEHAPVDVPVEAAPPAPIAPKRVSGSSPAAADYLIPVLPGENLAKYRGRSAPDAAVVPVNPSPRATAVPEPEATAMAEADEERTPEGRRQAFEHDRVQPDSPAEGLDLANADAVEAESEDLTAAASELAAESAWAGPTADESDWSAEPPMEDADAPEGESAAGEEDALEETADDEAADATLRAGAGEARLQAPARSGDREGRRGRGRRRRGRGRAETAPPLPPPEPAHEPRDGNKNESSRLISDMLHEGQEILVQIAKEPLGKKGARITSHLALPGRYLVYMPTVNHIGVSRKISSDEERARLKRLILENTQDLPGGFIVRTAGAAASDEEFKADIRLLAGQWNELRSQFEQRKSPALLHHDLNLVERTLRDQLSHDFTHIWVDNEEQYQRMVRFVGYFMPDLADRVRLYTREEPIFEHFGIQAEIDKALKSKVWLKSGGYIVLNQTEALVAIDVNTGKYVGKSNRLEDTIVKTNVDAIKEIVRQIRLRDLGGIIVIDFIDMDERRNRQRVMQALDEAMRADRAPSKILSFNDFGLVALTRKRVKQSLERTLGSPCPYCEGVGLVKAPITVCNEIYAEVKRIAPTIERGDLVLRVNPDVAKELKAHGAQRLRELEEVARKPISIRPDPQVHQEQYEIY